VKPALCTFGAIDPASVGIVIMDTIKTFEREYETKEYETIDVN